MNDPEFKVTLTLRASVSPSEDQEKVARALENIVGESAGADVRLGSKAELYTRHPKALSRIRDQLRDRHVRGAARRQMLLNMKGDSTSVMLNRQAAAAGVLALCGTPEESPLGPIYLRIKSERLQAAIDWLAAYSG